MTTIRQRIISLTLTIALLFSAVPSTAAETPLPDPRFGAVEAYAAPQQAADLRVGWDRMIIHWNTRQPDSSGQWIVSGAESPALAEAQTAGREVVALLMGTPAWATDGTPNIGVPRGLYLPVSDPGNVWAAFVRTIVAERKGQITHWIIWNEPDITPEDYGAQFEGPVEDYYQLIKVAYLAAKESNPDAVIHFAGLTYWHDIVHKREPYLKRFLDLARKDSTAPAHNYYFDVLTAHIYFRTETIPEIISFYRRVLRQYGLNKPIWLNETNAAPMDDPQYPANPLVRVTMDQQASFIIQANALALAYGAERIAIYKLTDNTPPMPGGESYGLFRPDGTPRPAVEAFRVVTTHFAGVQQTTHTARRDYYLVTLNRGDAVTRIAWARTWKAVTLKLRATPKATAATLYDQFGKSYPITADSRGNYTLTLPAAVCVTPYGCAVGGAPWILVETFTP